MILFGARLALSLTGTSPEKPGIATLHPLSGGDDSDAGLSRLGSNRFIKIAVIPPVATP